jgi:hypothetical protein
MQSKIKKNKVKSLDYFNDNVRTKMLTTYLLIDYYKQILK